MVDAGHDVLDFHFYFRHHVNLRAPDGIHWNGKAHRRMSNLLLTHICEAWGIALPGRRQLTPVSFDVTMYQPPGPEERYGGPIGRGNIQYNRDYTYASASNHQRSTSCDPSYLGSSQHSMMNYGIGLVATNLLLIRASQMAYEHGDRSQWGSSPSQRGGQQRYLPPGSTGRYHPYHGRNNY